MPARTPTDLEVGDSPPPEWVHAYVAALVDSHSSLVVSLARASNRSLGYRPKQEFRYKTNHGPILELLKKYCTAHDIRPRVSEQSGTTYPQYTFEISARSDIIDFLTPLRPYLRVRNRAVTLLLDTLLPGLDAGAHSDPDAFLTWTRYLDAFREASGRANRHKYDHAYFQDRFDVDVPAEPQQTHEWVNTDLTSNSDEHNSTLTVSNSDETPNGESGRSGGTIESDPDWLSYYVAGLVDGHFDFVVAIGKQEMQAVGYKITHRLQYNSEGREVCDVLRTYLTSIGFEPRIRERTDTEYAHYEVTIAKRADIMTLLETVRPFLVAREEATRILCEELLPALDAGLHSTRKGFVELVGTIETFREAAGIANRAEYTQKDFIKEWNLE